MELLMTPVPGASGGSLAMIIALCMRRMHEWK
jgi:hypothetical protein